MKNRGTIYNLIWLDRGENDPDRYEYFTAPSAIYKKYNAEQLGVAQGTLLNMMGRLGEDGKPIVYMPPKNPNLRIVKGILYGKDAKEEKEKGREWILM